MQSRVLVIDDEKAVRKSFELALKKTGFEVDTADNGNKGLEFFMKKDYDLVYLDLKMPGMSGAETLVRLREKNQSVPIYIVTAFHREFFDELAEARKKEIDFELLMKPLGLEQIRDVTHSICAENRLPDGGEGV